MFRDKSEQSTAVHPEPVPSEKKEPAVAPKVGTSGHVVQIGIVEDEKILSQTLGVWLDRSPGFHIVGQASGVASGWEMCVTNSPEVVLMDVGLPDGDGLTLAKRVREELPAIRVIILTGKIDPHTAWRSMEIGAHGLVDKASDLTGLREAISIVAGGGEFISTSFKQIREELMAESAAFYKVLSDRELEVLFAVTEGLMDADISAKLKISADTVACHRKNIRRKLELHDDRSLIAYGRKWGTFREAPATGPRHS